MKFQKLFLRVATGCLLVSASGVAMAQTVDCAGGTIIGQQVDEIVINGQPCYIEDTTVNGNVTVTDSPDLDMINVEVKGNVSVQGSVSVTEGGSATLLRVDSFSGNIDVSGHSVAIVGACIVRGATAGSGNMTVNNNAGAVVYSNVVVGNLTCTGNIELDQSFNRVYGTENCQRE